MPEKIASYGSQDDIYDLVESMQNNLKRPFIAVFFTDEAGAAVVSSNLLDRDMNVTEVAVSAIREYAIDRKRKSELDSPDA